MLAEKSPVFLLGSPEPEFLHKTEPVLLGMGAQVEVAVTAQAALAALMAPKPPDLALLDVDLPGMPIEQLLAAARASAEGQQCPIVLITDVVTQTWINRVAEGIVDDLAPRHAHCAWLQFRLTHALRLYHMKREAESLRESIVMNAQLDRLTGVYNREAMLALLFRETDRVQRHNTAMCLVLFDVDDFGHWNSRLGVDTCDELLCQIVARANRLLRSYDLLGRPGMDSFLIALPGCGVSNALMLAERLRLEVFSQPFHVPGESIRLSACFGISSSQGRSPVVVLREAEEALVRAKQDGPETIQCFGESTRPAAAPVTFLSPTSGDELLAW
ncbi:MAG: diguanylate cyclase [Terracidiphilus sp.]|jgi:diguanylate cyclase (GGDEF)-like protein